MAVADSGVVRRGLFLLAGLGLLAGAVLFILFRPTSPAVQRTETRSEYLAALVAVPGASFPGGVGWGALYLLGDALPSTPGWEIRYTSTRVLAHKGSSRVPLNILGEMLDEERQMRNFRTRLAGGREVADEAAARQEVLIALKAVSEWHKFPAAVQAVPADHPDLQKLYRAVTKLTHSSNKVVSTRAQETLLALPKVTR